MTLTSIFSVCIGLSPDDSFDEAVADMITDSVTDIKNAVIKAHFEKDEAKKVFSSILFALHKENQS